MDIVKLLEDSDPLIGAAKLNEIHQGKIQNIFIMVARSLDQRKKFREHSTMSNYVLSLFTLKLYW